MTLAIALGAMVGALLRHYCIVFIVNIVGGHFPWGTLFVNIIGSFLLGMVVAWLAFKGEASPEFRAFLVVGVLGSFTTFSAFSLETILLFERGYFLLAAGYVLGSVCFAIGGLALGMSIMKMLIKVA